MEIVKWTREGKGNVSQFYNGQKAIGDTFYGKFWEVYGSRLRIEGFNPPDLSFTNDPPIQTYTKSERADLDKEMARLQTENMLLRKENQLLRDIIIHKLSVEELEKFQIAVSRPEGH